LSLYFLVMIISNISLKNFRNHTDTHVSFKDGINLITGPNGVGKTNLVDAIHYLCMSKSFVTASDSYVVKQGESSFEIHANIAGSLRQPFNLSCIWNRGEGKKFFVNDSPLDKLSDLIGTVPVVVLCPEDKKITNEGPAERRAFLDAMISQYSKNYLADLIDYRKILRQRNSLLSSGNTRNIFAMIEAWDHQLAGPTARIVAKRHRVLLDFATHLEDNYAQISNIRLKPTFEYKTFCEPTDEEEAIKSAFLKKLEENREKEMERQLTLVGPHRDELVFLLDGMEIRKFGSQGQHRLFALALKMSQLTWYYDIMDDLPIFLLDDVFGDLDPQKIQVLTNFLNNHDGQTFITSANISPFNGLIDFNSDKNQSLSVSAGPEISGSSN